MVLKTLKPRLASLDRNRVRTLDTKAGATERIRGSAWMRVRHAVLLRDLYTCVNCGLVSKSHDVDHITPLEQGGDATAMSNLQSLCSGPDGCHARKSSLEQKVRRGNG